MIICVPGKSAMLNRTTNLYAPSNQRESQDLKIIGSGLVPFKLLYVFTINFLRKI